MLQGALTFAFVCVCPFEDVHILFFRKLNILNSVFSTKWSCFGIIYIGLLILRVDISKEEL